MWGMTYPSWNSAYAPLWYESLLIAAHLAAHVYRWNPLVTAAFVISMNISYSINIVADHDTADAALVNHIDVDTTPGEGNYGTVDWGVMQVCNSSNFANHWAQDLFAQLNGAINYQIEHHLFPGMSHIHLPRIAPIVRQTCEEFNVPYAAYTNLWGAWYSFIVTCQAVMSGDAVAPASAASAASAASSAASAASAAAVPVTVTEKKQA